MLGAAERRRGDLACRSVIIFVRENCWRSLKRMGWDETGGLLCVVGFKKRNALRLRLLLAGSI